MQLARKACPRIRHVRLRFCYAKFIQACIYYTDPVDIEDVEGFRNISCCPSNLTSSFVNFTYVLCCIVPAT